MNTTSSYFVLSVVLAIFLLLLPIVITVARTRVTLNIAAFILCGLSIVTLLVGTVAAVAFVASLPIAGGFWFTGFICALVSWFDARQDQRNRELALRLLTNDAYGLGRIPK